MRPMNRSALADMHATAVRLDRERRDQFKADAKYAREHRTPRPVPVMPDVHVGGVVHHAATGAAIVVAKVNAKSVVSTGGVRYGAGEIEVDRMTDINAVATRANGQQGRTVTRGQVAKAVLALTREPEEMRLLAEMLGYRDERTYRAVGALQTINGAVGR